MKNYKKLFIFILVITVITSILVVSVCAESTTIEEGTYLLNKTLDFSTWTYAPNWQGLNFECDGVVYNSMCGSMVGGTENRYTLFYGNTAVYSSSNGWVDDKYRTITVNTAITKSSIVSWFNLNYSLLTCDGSTCSSSDMNNDNICDVCGLPFPLPLWRQILQSTQREMSQTSEEVVSVMMTLTLCGVGLMASLVVLKLFGKRSLIFRC